MMIAQAWVAYGEENFDEALAHTRKALYRNPDIESGYYLLGRVLFSAGRHQELVEIADEAISHAGENYNTYIPISNALGSLGKTEARMNMLHHRSLVGPPGPRSRSPSRRPRAQPPLPGESIG